MVQKPILLGSFPITGLSTLDITSAYIQRFGFFPTKDSFVVFQVEFTDGTTLDRSNLQTRSTQARDIPTPIPPTPTVQTYTIISPNVFSFTLSDFLPEGFINLQVRASVPCLTAEEARTKSTTMLTQGIPIPLQSYTMIQQYLCELGAIGLGGGFIRFFVYGYTGEPPTRYIAIDTVVETGRNIAAANIVCLSRGIFPDPDNNIYLNFANYANSPGTKVRCGYKQTAYSAISAYENDILHEGTEFNYSPSVNLTTDIETIFPELELTVGNFISVHLHVYNPSNPAINIEYDIVGLIEEA